MAEAYDMEDGSIRLRIDEVEVLSFLLGDGVAIDAALRAALSTEAHELLVRSSNFYTRYARLRLDKLGDEAREEFINELVRVSKEDLHVRINFDAEDVDRLFCWGDTRQDHEYWQGWHYKFTSMDGHFDD